MWDVGGLLGRLVSCGGTSGWAGRLAVPRADCLSPRRGDSLHPPPCLHGAATSAPTLYQHQVPSTPSPLPLLQLANMSAQLKAESARASLLSLACDHSLSGSALGAEVEKLVRLGLKAPNDFWEKLMSERSQVIIAASNRHAREKAALERSVAALQVGGLGRPRWGGRGCGREGKRVRDWGKQGNKGWKDGKGGEEGAGCGSDRAS